MKKFVYSLIGLIAVILLFVLFPIKSAGLHKDKQEVYTAKIVEIIEENKADGYTLMQLEVLEGPMKGQSLKIKDDASKLTVARKFSAGDKVMITRPIAADGQASEQNYYILDFVRSNTLFWLFALFILVVLWVTRYQGLGALIGMAFSFWVIFKIVLPSILAGNSAISAAIFGIALIVPISFYLSHGINRKTTIATFSTLITLIITGVLASVFGSMGNLSGLSSEELNYLVLDNTSIFDFSGLVIAGIMIGVSGILDDVTISQASVVQELKAANKNLSFWHLFNSAMRVGRDHIASMVNTLVLVYAGSSLPLLLLFIDRSKAFGEVVNYESVATQIVETLVGSIGLILAVPITTVLACAFLGGARLPAGGHGVVRSHKC